MDYEDAAVLFQVESSSRKFLYRGQAFDLSLNGTHKSWGLIMIWEKRFQERRSKGSTEIGMTTTSLRNRKRINVIRVWWEVVRYVQGGGKEPRPDSVVSPICPVICSSPCLTSVPWSVHVVLLSLPHTLSSIIFLHINILFSQTSVKFSNS